MAGDTDGRSPLKQALVAVRQLKARVAELEAHGPRAGGAIAVIGIGCRFPGGATDPERFWRLLHDGVDATSSVPADRWDAALWPELPKRAGFLETVDRFDATFFGIAPREAVEMDPAQRLLLEVVWHALEDAQLAPSRLRGSRTGVWLGLGLSDYGRRHFLRDDPTHLTAWSGTGSFLSVASGRIAYALGLRGPALTVDTACSSSLVSTHLAMRALRSGEADIALAAGANLLLSPMPSAYFHALQALSPDGRCKTFSEDADGYGRGEGVGVLVLKRLEDALADGDPIRAVLRGSAVNQDGRSNGLTAPSGRAQQQVIREALADAGLTPADVRVIEAHGTGTPLGDPIEVDALRTVFGDEPLWVGSVKTNIGHTETAAGVAGLIKSILSVERRTLAPHLHLGRPNPRLRLHETAVCIPEAPLPWPDAPARVGVSGFGLSGTNAHIIVEAAPDVEPAEPVEGPGVLVLSARTEEALSLLVQRTIDGWQPDAWRALEATAARRDPLPLRVAAVGATSQALLDDLKRALPRKASGGGTVWMFTGQGSQWPGMGRSLYQAEPAFAEIVDRVAEIVPGLLDLWLVGDERIHDTRYTQPAIYALQCGLATLCARHGAAPDALLGHSIGEYAAGWLANVFSLEDGARLVEARGRLMSELPKGGAMTAVFATLSRLGEVPEGVELAAWNHPNQSVFSGPIEAIEALEAQCTGLEVEVRRLQVSHAFHSAAMDPMLPAFRAAFEGVELRRPTIPWISTVDGEPVGERALDPDYWVAQLRQPVAFLEATRALSDHKLFFELGPHPALCAAVGRTLPDARLVPTLVRDQPADVELWRGLSTLWALGADVRVRGDRTDRQRAALPTMPFAPERHWLEPVETQRFTRVEALRWTDTASTSSSTPTGHWWVIASERTYAEVLEGAGCRVTWVEPGSSLDSLDAPDAVLVAEDARTPLRFGAEVTGAIAALQSARVPVSVIVRSERPSGLPGLLRVVRNELPGQAGALIWDPDDLQRILPELAANTPEVRLRGPRAIPERTSLPHLPGPRGGRIAWITGASGSLGRLLARTIAPEFERVVLLSRTGVPEAELVRLGPHVRSVQGDVTDNLVPLAAEEPPDVVYHLAGVLEDASIAETTPDQIERVCHPKIDGAWRLHEVAPEADLVLVGSAAAQQGNPGQAAYAIANSWLEGFAGWRRAQGVATWCVSLGPVAGTKMVRGHEERLQAEGHLLLQPSEAIDHIVQARAYEHAVLLAAPSAPTRAPVVADGVTIEEAVDRALLAVLGKVPPPDRGFFDAGMDSLMAQDLRVRLSTSLHRELPPTLAFDAPTRDGLIAFLGGTRTAVEAIATSGGDVAIIGMAVRVPGADDLEAFWTLLDEGIDAVRPIDRWSLDEHAAPSPTPGKHVIREAGLLDDVVGFDAERFGISPREAARLDPQQRLVLEASLAALEHAGLPTEDRVGVFVGIAASEYGRRFDPFASDEPDPYAGTGNESSFAAGRVSHALDLRGPALAINTACSSSLVAVHLAVRALRAGECKLALAGGVHVLAGPESTLQLDQIGALSPTGRCHTFSADADGYVRGEGVGMVLLKPLAQALLDGDTVWAVVKGSAVNHDGHSAGVTVPNGMAQRAVLRAALADADVDPATVDAVEAHGTGTRLGDPIEVAALRDVYVQGRSNPLALGSVKTNLGHLEAGAGIAGLIKTALALHHQRLPAHLHLGTPNPDLDLDGLEIPTRTRAWRGSFAGVSSFGISGTNAHVILARGPERAEPQETPPTRALQLLSTPLPPTSPVLPYGPLRPAQLRALAERPPRRWRTWSLGGSTSEPREPVQGEVAWLFTGQGSQRPGMEQPLLDEPVFAESWNQGLALLSAWDFPVEAFGDERIHLTQHAQPALFLHGYSLAAWLRSRGLEPDRVMGHSLGELTAAAVAGVWSFEEALRLVVARGRIMGELPSGGATAAVLTKESIVRAAIGDDPVDLAGINGPDEVVISGEAAAVEAVLARIDAPTRLLKVSHPFHSRHMEPAVAAFEAELAKVSAAVPRLPLHTNVDGQSVGRRALEPAHWSALIRQPVRFHLGVETLHRKGVRVFLEVGPRPILTGMVERALTGVRAIPTQPRDGDALDALYGAVGELWVAGVVPDWEALTGASASLPAPPSPRRRVRHWIEARAARALPQRWFHAVVQQPGEIHHTPDGTLYAGDLEGALASAQQAVRDGVRWAPADDDPALQAFARSFALEHPDHWGGPADDLRRLVPAAPVEQVPLRPDGVYLVTGGTGSLGRAIVAELTGEARTIHVLSRGGEPVEGATSHAVDVTDNEALKGWLADHPLNGIVHCAGVGRRVPLLDETAEGLEEVLAPKRALETLNLPELDFLIAIGSIASVWGSGGQVAYAAANGLLERTVARRRSQGRPTRLVSLGPVRGGLLDEEGEAWLVRRGLRALSPGDAARAVLRADGVVADVVWSTFLPVQTARLPQPLFEAQQPVSHSPLPASSLHRVHREAARILGLAPTDLPIDRGLFEAGMDSVTAVELARALSTEGRELPATLVFEHGTVAAISAFLAGQTPVQEAVVAPVAGDGIVIVGIGCRFPGGANDPASYWALLQAGKDAVRAVPADRWDAEAVYDPVPATPGRTYVRHGAFVDQVDRFDPLFFQIAPREAAALDPQQRLLLEVSWEALERAGMTGSLKEARVGVYVGIPESSYLQRFRAPGQPLYPDVYAGTGNESSFAAGRVAHVLGTQGPAIALNTACSSSLVTVHLAAEALRAGDCDAAVAGGVSLMLSPDNHIYLSQLQALAPDGRCKTFSSDADGYGRGEGAGVVVLMRASDARAQGRPILAHLLGSAVNHDGASSGLTVPNGAAQERVIRDAVARSGIAPEAITYIEAHGTGTRLGDPIEVRALRRALGDGPRFIGSVKTQIGHLEQAAGAAALIKVVLQLQHGRLAPHLHAESLNPDLDLGPLQVATDGGAWEGRVAGVSGFGLSGTNAHLVIGAGEVRATPPPSDGPLCWSASSEAGLKTLRTALAEPVATFGTGPVGATLWQRRPLPVRAFGDGPSRRIPAAPRLVFLFTGQGAQRPGMDEALYREEPVYREAFDEVATLFDLPLRALLQSEQVHDTRTTQPALFAVEWALATWWRSVGVEADLVLGHSIGELTAAAWAGMLRLPDAVRLVAVRANAMADQPAGGAMAALFADEDTVLAALVPGAELAGVNSPDETVITGEVDAVEAVIAALGVEHRRLTVSHAFHSARMDGAMATVTDVAKRFAWFGPRIPVVRNLDGLLHDDAPAPSYWAEQLRRPVRFLDGVRTLVAEGATTWLEVGPHPVLAASVLRVQPHAIAVGSSLKGASNLLPAAGALWTDGIAAPVDRWLPDVPVLDLPTTPFDRTRCWLDLPEFVELGSSLSRSLLRLAWEPIDGASPWVGTDVEITPGTLEEVWNQLVAAAAPLAEQRAAVRFITRGAALAGIGDPLLCAVHGFVRCARRELGLDWRCLDLPPAVPVPPLPDDPWLRLQDGQVLAARLVPATLEVPEDTPERVLITGGFGALGIEIARAWAPRAEVWLLSRTVRAEVLEELGVNGVAADVRDPDALREVLAGLHLTHVIHAAGVLADAPLGQTWDQVSATLEVKVQGALALREVLGEAVSYVFFSSASATLGAAGQTAYGAANAVLDGLAQTWRAEGLRVTSIGWGPWDAGMANTLPRAVLAQQAAFGIQRLSIARGVEALEGLRTASPALVLPMDWPRFLPRHGDPLLTHQGWRPAKRAPEPTAGWQPTDGLDALGGWLVETAREVLSMPTDRALPTDRPLQDFGLDSLMAITLRNRLADAGLDVPVARLIGGPSIEEIVAIAGAQLEPPPPAAAEPEEGLHWFHPLVTHGLLALLALIAGLVLGASMLGIQAPSEPTSPPVDRAPRVDR